MKQIIGIAIATMLLAGCATPSTNDEPMDDVPQMDEKADTIRFTDCWDAAGRFPIPYDDAQAVLPANFTALRHADFNDQALLFITGFECTTETPAGPELVRDLSTMILVDPPSEHELPGDDFRSHGYLVDWATSSRVASNFYASWGIPHVLEDVVASVLIDQSNARVGQVQATVETGPISVDTVAGGPVQPFGAGTVRVFFLDTEHGNLTRADVAWDGIPNTALGVGTLQHGHYGNVQSVDMFHAWTYAWDIRLADLGAP